MDMSSVTSPNICEHCGVELRQVLLCSRCKEAKYCCKEHQVAAWKGHKKACKQRLAVQQQDAADLMHAMAATASGCDPAPKKVEQEQVFEKHLQEQVFRVLEADWQGIAKMEREAMTVAGRLQSDRDGPLLGKCYFCYWQMLLF